jgi:ribonuclease E
VTQPSYGKADKVIVTTDSAVAIYMLNFRRDLIQDIESKFKIRIVVKGDDRLVAPDHRLELVTMKADGSQATQTMEYHLHDVQESEVKLGGNNRRRRGGKDKPRNGNNGNGNGGQGQQNQRQERQEAAPSAAEGATEAAPRAEGAAGNEPRQEGNRDRQDRGDRNGRRDRHGRRRDRNDRGGRPQRHEGGERQPQNVQGGTPGNTTEREIRDEDVVQPSPAEQEEQRKSVFQRWWNK